MVFSGLCELAMVKKSTVEQLVRLVGVAMLGEGEIYLYVCGSLTDLDRILSSALEENAGKPLPRIPWLPQICASKPILAWSLNRLPSDVISAALTAIRKELQMCEPDGYHANS